jgi:hypothetical protein
MPTIVLNTKDGDLLGFVLVAGLEPLETGSPSRKCVLTGVPARSALFDTALGAVIQDNKNTEFPCIVERLSASTSVQISVEARSSLLLKLDATRTGTWTGTISGRQLPEGACLLLPARAV